MCSARAEDFAVKKAVRDLLANYPPEVRALALGARALVLEVMPDAEEQADPADKLIGYATGQKMADIKFVIMPLRAAVNLGVYGGASLPDPDGLLEGTGKRHRHVKLRTLADVRAPALRDLLVRAAARQ